jgi:membrane protein YqaA with SNARE-associated domain
MGKYVDWVQSVALGLGAPGLFVAAFLDSSLLSLPEVNDFLLIWMTTQHKSRMLVYAASATLGSIAGCLLLYYIGHKGASVTTRFGSEAVERALASLRRHGMLAVLVPALLPPPAPFKIFVLLAGVADISVSRFVAAVAIGRGIRFFGEGFLALEYGDQAIEYVHANAGPALFATTILLLAAVLGWLVWKKASAQRSAGR